MSTHLERARISLHRQENRIPNHLEDRLVADLIALLKSESLCHDHGDRGSAC